MSTQALPRFTFAEYLDMERNAEFRSEYLQGAVVAMAGASRDHGRIAGTAYAHLLRQMTGKDCEPAIVDLRLFIKKYDVSTYPNVVVTCGPDVYLDGRRDTIVDATVIIEVLSDSTKNFDRGEKFLYYRSLPSFTDYLLLRQDTIRAEHHVRQPDGAWLFREITDPAAIINLASIGCTLPLGPLYERVRFDEQSATDSRN